MNFLACLGYQRDAVATRQKEPAGVLPIASTRTAAGRELDAITLTRADGDRATATAWPRATATAACAPSGAIKTPPKTRAQPRAPKTTSRPCLTPSQRRRRPERRAGRMGRIQRGAVTLEITLAIGQPALMVQSPVNVRGFKSEIDGTDWLCKTVEHTLDDNGLTARMEPERRGADGLEPK